MKTFGIVAPNDYNVEDLYVSAPMSWELISSSLGINITSPTDLEGAITFQFASSDADDYYNADFPKINEYTETYQYILYKSINHLFYEHGAFYSGSVLTTSSVSPIPDESYVISIAQNFYGDRIKPGSFELTTGVSGRTIRDDSKGNLYIVELGTTSYIGNIFYSNGIVVIKRDTTSGVESIDLDGISIIENTVIYLDYSSDVKLHRHEVNVKLRPSEFNFSPFNPSILSTYTPTTGSVSQSFKDLNISTKYGTEDTWNLYNLMGAGVIKPYITTIGLYNDEYELLAVAKVSEPIQRTFDVDQIFVVRFDT